MFRRFGLLLLLCLSALAVFPARAQEDWSALLYNSMTKTFLRVNVDGIQETFPLDLPGDAFISPREMAFSPDGSRVAYCLIEYTENGQNPTTLYVRDLESGTNLVEQDLGISTACRVTGNEDASLLSLGLIRYSSFDPAADTSQPAWEVLVIDAATGETLYTLNANSPAAASLEYPYGESFLPYVLHFSGNQVIFGQVPYGTEFPADFPTYTWQLDEDRLEPAKGWGYPFSAHLESTGEIAWLAQDETLPFGEPFGPVPSNNIVNVTDANDEPRVAFHSPDWILTGVEFMNGGAHLLLQLTEPLDVSDPIQTAETRWISLDRQGNKMDLFSSDGFASLSVAPGGYLVFSTTSASLPATYTLEYHGDGGIETLLTLESDQYGAWEVACVTPEPLVEDLPPFTAINP
jgi:hypothetical protein